MQRRHALQTLMVGASAIGAATVLMGCKPKPISFEGVDITGAEYGQDFPLPDAYGKPRSVSEFAGKVVVVFFGYTQCPDVCPTTLQELVEAKAILGEQGDRLQGIFVSLDPDRDTPEVLRAYAEAFDPQMVALTGSHEQITAVAKNFKVFYKKVEGKQPGSYTLDHSAGLYVYDPQGKLRVYQRYGQGAQILAKDAKALLDEAKA
ncbi:MULTISPECIES: SCO family protein [Comamonas]|uniref:SCO family protein n=1 Tax=Comamonas avium TaxID=2762231 RepID=A0ABR8SC43_9BURK|nr:MULTISPECIES: SCO family protein [Comamonas]MBD7961022.1 SCO family protein [Comamonas avium]MBD9400857.1 SCO family protein [Comamonas sp. CMM02]